jgi:hypothetical protein
LLAQSFRKRPIRVRAIVKQYNSISIAEQGVGGTATLMSLPNLPEAMSSYRILSIVE